LLQINFSISVNLKVFVGSILIDRNFWTQMAQSKKQCSQLSSLDKCGGGIACLHKEEPMG